MLVATKPVDFRKGANGLAALVREQLKPDPLSGTIWCFRLKHANADWGSGTLRLPVEGQEARARREGSAGS